MKKKVLITGISGFAGSHLAEHLVARKGFDISGTYLLDQSLVNIANIKNSVNLFRVNLTEDKKIYNLIKSLKPDLVFHLAALSSTADSFRSPSSIIKNNVIAQINLLSAIKDNNLLNTRILIVSSGEIYGLVKKEDLPIDEETKLMPLSPYAVSKITQDFLALQYFLSYNLKIVRVRPFNHIGPRQSTNFVVASFAKNISEIERGKRESVLPVGSLDAKRDFTDVSDMVRAYALAIENGREGDVYNLGSGKSYKISYILNQLLSLANVKITVRKDKSLLRPADIPELLCDATKFRKLTGWKTLIPIKDTLKKTLDYWRNMV